jgi:hypothetical protein
MLATVPRSGAPGDRDDHTATVFATARRSLSLFMIARFGAARRLQQRRRAAPFQDFQNSKYESTSALCRPEEISDRNSVLFSESPRGAPRRRGATENAICAGGSRADGIQGGLRRTGLAPLGVVRLNSGFCALQARGDNADQNANRSAPGLRRVPAGVVLSFSPRRTGFHHGRRLHRLVRWRAVLFSDCFYRHAIQVLRHSPGRTARIGVVRRPAAPIAPSNGIGCGNAVFLSRGTVHGAIRFPSP